MATDKAKQLQREIEALELTIKHKREDLADLKARDDDDEDDEDGDEDEETADDDE